MTYLLAQTVNKSTYSSEKNWVMAGDMNANSPLDCWYTGADPDNIAFKAQGYVLEHSDLKDSVYEFWNAGTPDTSAAPPTAPRTAGISSISRLR